MIAITCLKMFKWGSQNELTLENSLDFKGKRISLKHDRNNNEYNPQARPGEVHF